MRIEYCLHDTDPALLVYPGDGRILGFEYINDEWKEFSAAEISHGATVLTETSFKKMFPGIGLPEDLDA
jgi:hypothetical protein